MAPSLTSFTALSFDVYATLIDWETGITKALAPLNARIPDSHPLKNNRQGLLGLYTHFEGVLEHQFPGMHATRDEKQTFGNSVGAWEAFPDTVDALRRLGKRYKLIVLSNVDKAAFERTRTGPLQGVEFDAVYTAEEIGSYKPDLRNFEYMIAHAEQELGVQREGFLHTAQALKHDHVPAKTAGLKSCWIERAGDDAAIGGRLQDFGDEIELAFRFKTLGEMADAVEREFNA
ncbi:HAD-superfamily hydrolase [Nemania sp. FL0916]|nr:HAD-superfamily hydrolase [Nemania sp. FL0916]